jgi:hypothetical protein
LAVFFAGDFFAVEVFFAVEELVDFLAAGEDDFLAVEELADFLAGAFFAVLEELFFAGAFFAVEELDFLAVLEELFLAGAFFAVEEVDLLAVEVFFAAVFCVPELLFFAVEVFFAVEELEDFFAADEPPEAFFATEAAFLAGAVLAAAAAAFLAGADAFLATSEAFGSFGSFFWPDTTALRSAPAVNLGIAVFLAFTRSPVRGLRTHRASRMRFSNEPKPVIATFSPRATSRVMTSSTESSACCACFRLPS